MIKNYTSIANDVVLLTLGNLSESYIFSEDTARLIGASNLAG